MSALFFGVLLMDESGMWICPICGLPLTAAEKCWRCGRQHSFDRSRSGYAPLKKLIHRFFPAFLSGGEENPYSVGAETSIAQISSSVYFRTPRLLHTAYEGDIIVQ